MERAGRSHGIGARLQRKLDEVLRPGGAVVLWETVQCEPGPTPLGRAMEAVLDLGASPAAPPNTERSLREMLSRIGYASVQVVSVMGDQTTFVVGRKAR